MNTSLRQFFSRGISAKTALALLTLIVIIHIGISYVYIRNNHTTLEIAKRDEIIQKIINTIHLVQATPELNRQHAVDAIADPNMQVSFTTEPKWDLQFQEISFWTISRDLRNSYEKFAISIRMGDNSWLNISANVYTQFLFSQLFLVALEIIVLGAVLFAAWSIHRFTAPLQDFKKTAEKLGMDLYTKPIAIYGPNIVRETAEAINNMQTRLRDLIRDRTQMLAAISHDLRTPITRMKLRAQFLKDEKLLQKFTQDLDEMEAMIAQTLAFAREDCTTEESKNLELSSFIGSICDEMQDMGHQVTFTGETNRVPFEGRPLALKRALTNLINNAVKYAKNVEVILRYRNERITIIIQDDGPGIEDCDLEKVLQPFYRGDYSRSKDTGGVGLGLAVTKDIINHHGGDIFLKNREEGGLEVAVVFYH
ncbi:MAG: ATP-binding protein [Gammaproteobacteria bacterium]